MDSPNSQTAASTLQALQSQSEHNETNFHKVTLEAGRLAGKEFSECLFDRCTFRESIFRDCKFNDCVFRDCDLSLVRFEECSFVDTSFERSQVIGVDWTLGTWSKFQANSPITFTECVVDFSAFIGLTLRKLVMTKCSAREVEFSEADLTAANFSGTDLTKSRFQQTNLTKANFVGATNYSINLIDNKTTKAKFSLPEALSLLYGLDIVLVE